MRRAIFRQHTPCQAKLRARQGIQAGSDSLVGREPGHPGCQRVMRGSPRLSPVTRFLRHLSCLPFSSLFLIPTAPCVPGTWDDLPLSRCHQLSALGFYVLSPMLILMCPLFGFHAPNSSISSSVKLSLLSFAPGKPFM